MRIGTHCAAERCPRAAAERPGTWRAAMQAPAPPVIGSPVPKPEPGPKRGGASRPWLAPPGPVIGRAGRDHNSEPEASSTRVASGSLADSHRLIARIAPLPAPRAADSMRVIRMAAAIPVLRFGPVRAVWAPKPRHSQTGGSERWQPLSRASPAYGADDGARTPARSTSTSPSTIRIACHTSATGPSMAIRRRCARSALRWVSRRLRPYTNI
jgi:hypothetical protein